MIFKKQVLIIGDIHGLEGWEKIALEGLSHFYEVIFIGDYVDSFYVSPVQQINNLKNIIEFIKKYKNKGVTALLGNHDYAYIFALYGISGYQHEHAYRYRQLFQDNIELFDIAWGYTNPETKKYTLVTHAGLTQKFWNKCIVPELKYKDSFLNQILGENIKNTDIHKILNILKDKKDILWRIGPMRYGSGPPGPLWADREELLDDPMEGINQIFGHTPGFSITVDHIGDEFYACVDSWGNKKIVSLSLNL